MFSCIAALFCDRNKATNRKKRKKVKSSFIGTVYLEIAAEVSEIRMLLLFSDTTRAF